VLCCFGVHGLQGFYNISKVDLLVFLELWLGIGVKRMTFFELYLRMTSLELWFGMTDEHEELLSYSLGW